MPGSGCKTLWISLLLAIFFIVLTIALSLLSGPYTVSVAEAKASAQGAWRIDATVEAIALQPHFAELSLCSDGVCMTARAPLSASTRIKLGRDVVVKGALPDFRAGAAADAVPYRIGAEVQYFRFDPLAVKGAGDFGKGGKGTAVFLRT